MDDSRRQCRTIQLADELLANEAETPWLEFKENYADPEGIGKRVSGLSNSARLEDQECAYLVWGVKDDTRMVVGTTFDPNKTKAGNQLFEVWLKRQIAPGITMRFRRVSHPQGTLILLKISAAVSEPTTFNGIPYVRVGSATMKLVDDPQRYKQLLEKLRPYTWETSLAATFVAPDEVLRMIDYESYFQLTKQPLPQDQRGVFEKLMADELVGKDVGNRWNVTNLGAILFARDVRKFDSSLARKAVRFAAYEGTDRISKYTRSHDGRKGYATGFEGLVKYIVQQLPAYEHIEGVQRVAHPLVPIVALREVIASALVHQDMTITGAGPQIELFRDRIEISNPGTPLVEPDRMIDSPPKSRNEKMAALMRRMGFCEERGSGMDTVFAEVERLQLPAPLLQPYESAMVVTLFGPRVFAEMTRAERVTACYYHAALQWTRRRQGATNATLRHRFGVAARNAAQISAVIRTALDANLIKAADPKHPRSGYCPFWA